jgi:hypothetical protein
MNKINRIKSATIGKSCGVVSDGCCGEKEGEKSEKSNAINFGFDAA